MNSGSSNRKKQSLLSEIMSSSESTELSPSNSAQNDVEPTQPELLSKSEHESSDDDASGDESAPRASSPKSEMEEEYSSSEDELMPNNKFSDEEVRVAYEDLEETPQVSSENETRDSETPQVSEKPQARVEFDTSNSCNRRPEEKQANKRPRNPSSPTQNLELKKAKDIDAMQRSIDEMITRLHQSEIARKQDQQAYGQQIDRLMAELQKLNAINAQKDEENQGLVSRLMSLTQGPKIEELIMNLQNSETIRQRERERHGKETAEMMAELKQLRATIEQKDLRNQELVDQLMRLTAEK
uniref:Nucleolin 1-like n=1 Tax=Diabrotica virgifera virgifera TaxID=50390 RepID=A0A6P7H7P4_DIAVI